MKFTFKTEKPTGKWKSFQPTFHYIKFQKKEIGSIGDKKPHAIRLAVIKNDIMEDGNKNCEWKWITLPKQFDSLQNAKEWLNENFNDILAKHNIYKFD